MTVSVLYSEARHGSGTQLTLTASDVVVTSISSSSLTAGHRYLVLASIIFAGNGRQQADLKFGGVADTSLRGIYSGPSGGSGLKSHKAMTVWTAISAQDIELTAKYVSTGGVARNASLMAIDLDSGGLTEGVDWFQNVDSNRSLHIHHAFTEPAAVIECQAASTLVDGDFFTIDDGDGTSVTFEFDLAGNGVTGGRTAITLNPADTQATVRSTMRTAIDASALHVFTADQGSTAFMLVRPDGGDTQKITITESVAGATWIFGQWNPAILTFTPDGYSDYLVIGGARLDDGGSLKNCIMRLQDITTGTTICQSGIGSGNIGVEEHCLWGWGTLTAPAAVQKSIVTQYRTFSEWQKDEARIVVLRLNAFQRYSFFNSDINTVPVNTSRTSRGSVSITPSTNGELVIFGAVQSESKASFDTTAIGLAGAVELSASSIWDTNSSISPSVSYDDGSDNYTGLDGSRVGPFIFKKVTGQTQTSKTIELFSTSSSTASTARMRQMALLAFSTQEFLFPPLTPTNIFPAHDATNVARNANLSWDAADGEGTITYDIFFGDGYEDVIGELESAHLGNISYTSIDIPILEPNHTYYWSINANNEGGTTYSEVYSFTTGNDAAPDLAFNPLPENGTTLIDVPTAELSWEYGAGTDTFNVYVGTSPTLDGYNLISEEQGVTFIDINDLDYRQVYYWRIDTVGSGGVTTGDVWSFETIPLRFVSPRDGDKTYGVVVVSGYTRPGHGIHCELHSGMLLSDGYDVAGADGRFDLVLSYDNDMVEFGQDMALVAVSQASPDSVELHVNITQARRLPELPRGRAGRCAMVDNNTIALYEFTRPELGPEDNASAYTFVSAFNGSTAPSPFAFDGTASYVPTSANGVMTMYNFNTSATYSRLSHTAATTMPNFVTGFTYKYRVRFAPIPGGTTTACTTSYIQTNDGYEWRVLANSSNGFSLSSVLDTVTFTQPTINFYDWNEITVRGKQLDTTHPTGSQASRYLELYVNGTKVSQAYANTTGTTNVHYLGNAFTGSVFWTADFDYLSTDNTNPFVKTHMSNSQGDPSRDLTPFNGPTSRPVTDPTVPFNHALRLNGTDHYAISRDPALDLVAPFTIEGWFRTTATGLTQTICGKESSPTNGFNIYINSSDQLSMFVSNGSNNVLSNLPNVDTNKWHHFAMTYTGSVLIGYYDGVEFDRQTVGFTANTAQDFSIGADSTTPGNYFSGDIAQIKVSNRVVPAWEIYNTFYAVDDPIAILPADEHTFLRLDLRTQDEVGNNYCYSTHQNASYNAPTSFDFTSDPEYYNTFFNFGRSSADGYAGVYDGYLLLNTDIEPGVQHFTYADTWGKVRLKGNFDITIDVNYFNKHAVHNGTNHPAYILLYNMSNVSTIYLYVETNTISYIQSYTVPPTLGTDDGQTITIATQPNTIKFRIIREGATYRLLYGLNGAAATTAMTPDAEMFGPSGDLWLRVLNYTQIDTLLQDDAYGTKITNIDILGANGAPGDGYAILDTKGFISSSSIDISSFGPVWNFNGINNHISGFNHEDFNHADLTIEMWAQTTALSNYRLIGREMAPNLAKFSMDLGVDGYLAAEIRDTDNNSIIVQGGTYTPNKWQYFVMTYSTVEKTVRIYIDGVQVGRGSNSSITNNFESNVGIQIGRNDSLGFISTPLSGKVASVRMSNTVRSSLEIFNIFKGAKARDT